MNNRSLLIICILLPLIGMAQTHKHDSLYLGIDNKLEEAVVTGTRNETDIRHLSQTVTIISRKTIENSQQYTLLPVLTEEIPSLFTTSRGMMGFGVSNGAAGGMSLRGLSGNNARLMVLIDGHPQYAGIFGHPISDAYQTLLAERVEVLRGPSSVLYGSNAMGGVVNIVTRSMHEDGFRTHLRAGYGSFNTLETEATGRFRKGRFSGIVSGSYNRSDEHRENMDFEQYSTFAKFGYDLTKNWNARADVNVTHFNAANPGPISASLLECDQRITRGMSSVSFQNSYDRTSGGVNVFYNWGRHYINDGYAPEKGEPPQDGRFRSFDDMMGISVFQSIRIFNGNRVTLGADWFRYGGHARTEYVKGENSGTSRDIVDKHENEVAGYIDFRQDIGTLMTCNAGLRADHHSRVGTEWIPQAGLAFHLSRNIELKVSASKGFRYPILREMYMFPPQNPDLKPESAWSYEIAFSQTTARGRFKYGINMFYIDGKNLIVNLPNPHGAGRLNQNSGTIDNAGIELQAASRISEKWSVETNYSFLHMKNPVIASPEHKMYAGARFQEGRWNVSTGIQYVAGLFTSTEPAIKEKFALWNMRASFKAAKMLDIWVRAENLLAQSYEINAGYPMPRATIMTGTNIKF